MKDASYLRDYVKKHDPTQSWFIRPLSCLGSLLRLGREMEVVEALQPIILLLLLRLVVALVSPGRPPYGWCWKRGHMEREDVGGNTTAEGFWFFDLILRSCYDVLWHDFWVERTCSFGNSICSPTIVSGDSGARKEARGRRLWPPSWSGTLHIDNWD